MGFGTEEDKCYAGRLFATGARLYGYLDEFISRPYPQRCRFSPELLTLYESAWLEDVLRRMLTKEEGWD